MTKQRKRKVKKDRILFVLIVLILIIGYFLIKGKSSTPNVPNTPNPPEENNIPNTPKDPEEPTTYLNKISKESNFTKTVDSKLEEVLINYMDLYFKTMSTLEEIDMTSLFKEKDSEEAMLHQTAISLLVNVRKLEKNDMRIHNPKYDIIYKKMTTDGNKITITFLENDYLHFEFMKNIESKVYNIENTITFEKIEEDYKIISVRKIQDFYVMITNKYTTGNTKEIAKQKLDTLKKNHIEDYQKQLDILNTKRQNYLEGKDKPTKTCDHGYDREKALTYANKYITTRNPDWYAYDLVGGNCQNYASQILYAGGIPMDTVGSTELQWKHYSSTLDVSNNASGRSNSWTTVSFFYNYAKNNTGFGLCSVVDANPFYGEAGDVGQVGYGNGYSHTVIVVGSIKDENGKVVDLLLNSNTVTLENYPLSGYIYPNKRIIKVMGWND